MPENIRINSPNFCIGPQVGTYCSINTSSDPVTMQVKNSSGSLIRTYSFYPEDILQSEPYNRSVSSYVSGQIMHAKSFIFDFKNNHGNPHYVAIRSIDFYDADDNLIELEDGDFNALASSWENNIFLPKNAFITSKTKVNSANGTSWRPSRHSITNQRLICNFNEYKDVKSIVVNNYHDFGWYPNAGAKDTLIYYSDLDQTSAIFGFSDESMVIIFNNELQPHVNLNTEDGQLLSLQSSTSLTNTSEPTTIKYVGPKNQSAIYDGAVFYTLEKIFSGMRYYYTYDDENNLDKTETDVEYSGNVIRKWVVNNNTFTLDLVSSIYKNSDSVDWFGGDSFAVETYETTLLESTPAGTGKINFTTVSGIAKYDTILLGPSSDTTNLGAFEEAYIHSIDEVTNDVEIRTYGGSIPPVYEYVIGDPVVVVKNIHLFCDPRPLLDSSNIRYGFDPSGGTLYTLKLSDFGNIISRKYSGIFSEVMASVWNTVYNCISFVKGLNLLHFDLDLARPIKSQYLISMYKVPDDPIITVVYDIDLSGPDFYRLQNKEIILNDVGGQSIQEYNSFNYILDTYDIYSSTISVYASNSVVGYQGVSIINAVVRDQFGVGLINKEVNFSILGDVNGHLTPASGNVTTDANGYCSVQYTAGGNFNGSAIILAKATGGNSGFGSAYASGYASVYVFSDKTDICSIRPVDNELINLSKLMCLSSIKENEVMLLCFVRRQFPGGEWIWNGSSQPLPDPTINDRNRPQNNVEAAFLETVYQPFFNGIVTDTEGKIITSDNSGELPKVFVDQNDIENLLMLPSLSEPRDSRNLSQNYISRHTSFWNVVTDKLNQFQFTQEAIPNFWSEKNARSIDYWIRLRPFAYSLDPSTLVINVYSVYYKGSTPVVDIAPLGTITMFDAGSGLEGIDFNYHFPEEFHNNATVFVEVIVYDTAPVPNIITVSYWFKIVPDFTKPYIENRVPDIEEYEVNINTPVSFDIRDKGEGVDIDTLEVFINNRQVTFSYTEFDYGQYHIYCNIPEPFFYGQSVNIIVFVNDRAKDNNILRDSWSFYCIESAGPWIDSDNVVPDMCVAGMDMSYNDVSFQVYGINETGVDYDSIRLDVGGKKRNVTITPIVYRLR